MPDTTLYSRLKKLFSNQVIVRNVGGKKLKVADTDNIQGFLSNAVRDRYARIHAGSSTAGGGSYGTNMAYQSQRIMLFRDYDLMDNDPIIASSLDIFSDESTVKNEYGEILTVHSDNIEIKEVLHNLFYDILNIEFNLWPWTRNLCKYGDFFLFLEISPEYGIHNVLPLSVYDTTRLEGQDPQNPYYVQFESIGIQGAKQKFENYEIAHFRLLSDSNFLPYGKSQIENGRRIFRQLTLCLHGDSNIWTPSGPIKIKDLNVGDIIYSWNSDEQVLEPTRIKRWSNTGIKQTYEIKTATQKIKLTDNHPVMISDGSYKLVRDLTTDDYLVLPNKGESDGSIDPILALLNQPQEIITNFKGEANIVDIDNIIKNLPQFIRFIGFMLGDGWLDRHSVCFSLGTRLDKSMKYIDYLTLFGLDGVVSEYGTSRAYARSNSSHFCKILEHCGFKTGTMNKEVPDWVFQLPQSLMQEFLLGFADADGTPIQNGYKIAGKNERLMIQLQSLAQLAGYTCCNLSKHEGGYYPKWDCERSSWYETSFRTTHKNSKVVSNKLRYQKIWKITLSDIVDVYDLEVESKYHNFVSNGVIVHNCEDAMMIHRIMRAPDKRVYKVDIGNIPPSEVDAYMQKLMDKTKKVPFQDPQSGEYNLRYNMQNMMEDFYLPVRGSDSGTSIENLSGLEYNGIEDVEYLRNKLFAALKIPKAFLGYDESVNGKATLAAEDVRFARTIERIQRIIVSELTKIATVHLYAQGYKDEELVNFSLELTNPSTIYEQEKVNLWTQKAGLVAQLQGTKMFSRDWMYANVWEMSEDEANKEKDTLVKDSKDIFRLTQIEQGQSDPARFGFPQDQEPQDPNMAQGGLGGGAESPPSPSGNGPNAGPPSNPSEPQVTSVDQLPTAAELGLEENLEEDDRGAPRKGPTYAQDSHVRGRDPLGFKERYKAMQIGTKRHDKPKSPLSLEMKNILDKFLFDKPKPSLHENEEVKKMDKKDEGTYLDDINIIDN